MAINIMDELNAGKVVIGGEDFPTVSSARAAGLTVIANLPISFSGNAGRFLVVNEDEDGYNLADSANNFTIIEATYADLVANWSPTEYSGRVGLVLTTTGTILVDQKKKGLYYSDGSTWEWMQDFQVTFNDGDTVFYDNLDTSKRFQFQLSGISSGTTRTVTMPDADITMAGYESGALNAEGNVTLPSGAILTTEAIQAVDADGIGLYDKDGVLSLSVNDGGTITLYSDLTVAPAKTITLGDIVAKPYSILGRDGWQLTKDVGSEYNYYFEIDNSDGALNIATNSEGFWFYPSGKFQAARTELFGGGGSAAPEYTFLADDDTGIFLRGTNSVGIACGGSERMSVSLGVTQHNQKQVCYSNISDATTYVIQTVGQAIDSSNTTAVSASLLNTPSINNGAGTWSYTPVGLASNRCAMTVSAALASTAAFTGVAEFYADSDFSVAITAGGTLAITNMYGLYYRNPDALGTGVSVTNQYGIFVEAPTRGATKNIGIYNAGSMVEESTQAYYIGDPYTDGAWKTAISTSGYLVDAKRISGAYQDYLWNDYNIPGLSLQGGASAPDLVALNGSSYIYGYAFDGVNTAESASGVIEILHGYKEGTDIRPHIHWQPSTNDAGNVKWFIEYYYVVPGGTATTPATLSVVDAASGTAWSGEVVEFSAISGTNLVIGTQIHFAVYRDPADAQDTYPEDAILDTFGIHVQEESQGSLNVFTK